MCYLKMHALSNFDFNGFAEISLLKLDFNIGSTTATSDVSPISLKVISSLNMCDLSPEKIWAN
jgi:hypothetical protein